MLNVTVEQAVEIMRKEYKSPITAEILRTWIRSNKCPFGVYVKEKGRQRGIYIVIRDRLHAYCRPVTVDGQQVVNGGLRI